jgi:hypothetical protein
VITPITQGVPIIGVSFVVLPHRDRPRGWIVGSTCLVQPLILQPEDIGRYIFPTHTSPPSTHWNTRTEKL